MKNLRKTESIYEAASWLRSPSGPRWKPSAEVARFGCRSQIGWQSNGGPHRGHPSRALPFSFEAPIPDSGPLRRVLLVGVFAMFAESINEAHGTIGATVQLMDEREMVFRQDLLNGRHYSDAQQLDSVLSFSGDGSGVETVGQCEIDDQTYRVDVLSIDIPSGTRARSFRFKDLGGPSSFVIFDVIFEFEKPQGCPFRSESGGVSLEELGSVIRIGDRVRFARALQQLEDAIFKAEDLDEARGQTLTFLAIALAAALEMGGPREMHRRQLEAARELDRQNSASDIALVARKRAEELATRMFATPDGPTARLMDFALSIVERNYARPLSDAQVAEQLGLSRSHFRHLFRQATGQSFHRYVVAVRLEKAKRLLMDQDLTVTQVAEAVGFTGMSHFSRAFTQRFDLTPTSLRRSAV